MIDETTRRLKVEYFRCMKDLKLNMGLAEKWWNALEQAYTASNRHHRTFEHVANMLMDIDLVINNYDFNINQAEFDFISLVVLFHEIGFDPRNDLWQEKSANIWMEFCESVGIPSILGIKGYQVIDGMGDFYAYDKFSGLVYDAELDCYSDFEPTYERYMANIRKEYIHLNDAEWAQVRKEELEQIKGMSKIYQLLPSEHMDDIARKNIEMELRSLALSDAWTQVS